MMKEKRFDCVRMKHEIQQRIREENEGLSQEERRRRTEEAILADPVLGRIWRNLSSRARDHHVQV